MDLGAVIEVQHQNGTRRSDLPWRASRSSRKARSFSAIRSCSTSMCSLVGGHHHVDQHQHLRLLGVVRQRALHADGADILSKRRQGRTPWRRAPYHWDRSCDLPSFHESRKCVLAAHGTEHPAVRVTSWIAARQAWIEIAELLALGASRLHISRGLPVGIVGSHHEALNRRLVELGTTAAPRPDSVMPNGAQRLRQIPVASRSAVSFNQRRVLCAESADSRSFSQSSAFAMQTVRSPTANKRGCRSLPRPRRASAH